VSHAFAEFFANFAEPRPPALVFHSIVKQRRNGHLFVAAVLDHQGSHTQQVANVRPFGAFTNLPAMQPRGIDEGLRKLVGENRP
jgi:hypothetical protein